MNKGTEELIASMKAAAEKATPGEWYSDHIDTDGTYGNGDDCREGWKAAGVYSERGDLLLDSSNSDVAIIREEYDEDGFIAFDETGFKNAEFVVACRPENVLALIAALEQARRHSTEYQLALAMQEATIQMQRQRIAELEASRLCVHLPNLPELGSNAEWYQGYAAGSQDMRGQCRNAIRAAGGSVQGSD